MRKLLFSLSLAFVMASGVAYSYDDPSISGWDNKSKFAQEAPGKAGTTQVTTLKWVRNCSRALSTGNIASGDVVVYSTVSDDGISVLKTTTSADGAIAGIAVTAILTADGASTSAFDDAGRRNWGWILVHGKTFANASAGGTNGNAVGAGFITSTDAGAITAVQTGATTALDNLTKGITGIGGFFYDAADGTSTSYEVQVDLE